MIRKIFYSIFGYNLYILSGVSLVIFVIWVILSAKYSGRRFWRFVNALLFAVILFYALGITLVKRDLSRNYYISFSLLDKLRRVKDSHDLYREIFMNALLFFPLGLSVPQLIYRENAWKAFRNTVIFAFLLSFCIELLQYALSLGNAEMSDLVFNTLGAAVGACSILISHRRRRP